MCVSSMCFTFDVLDCCLTYRDWRPKWRSRLEGQLQVKDREILTITRTVRSACISGFGKRFPYLCNDATRLCLIGLNSCYIGG